MLTTQQQYVLALIRRSFGIKAEEFCPQDCTGIADMILRNGILLQAYPAIKAEGNTATRLEETLRMRYFAELQHAVQQNFEGNRILTALGNAGLNCIALKGWELRKLYPNMQMRSMADLDILVNPYDYKSILNVFTSLGYKNDGESSWKHDNFYNGAITVEMHKRLTDDSTLIQQWENEMWKRATEYGNHLFRMSQDDYYIFHIIHMHKDFMNGSLGLRRIVDTWLLQNEVGDKGFIEQVFQAMSLKTFHDRMVQLSCACMGDIPIDDNSAIMLVHAFKHGIYGSDKSYKAGRIAAMSKSGSIRIGKLKSLLAAVFLPVSRMKAQFPILQKWPILLPFCWTKRILRFLHGNISQYRKMLDYSSLNTSDYDEMKAFFKAGGV